MLLGWGGCLALDQRMPVADRVIYVDTSDPAEHLRQWKLDQA